MQTSRHDRIWSTEVRMAEVKLEGFLRAEDGKVVRWVQGQIPRSRLRVECLEGSVRAVVFICRGEHWRLLNRCEM